jgi:hypothetical protein
MKYGQIMEIKEENEWIYYCFKFISDLEAQKFVKKFKEQPHDNVQIYHTYGELILGAYLSKNGFRVVYEHIIDSKTPDWCILDDNSQLQCIIELATLHHDVETNANLFRAFQKEINGVSLGRRNAERLYQAIDRKASIYKSIANQYDVPFILSLVSMLGSIKLEELDECLSDNETGLFKKYPEVSGFLLCRESRGIYLFTFEPNPYSRRVVNIPSGQFDKDSTGA